VRRGIFAGQTKIQKTGLLHVLRHARQFDLVSAVIIFNLILVDVRQY
jgi:hypothetical protein